MILQKEPPRRFLFFVMKLVGLTGSIGCGKSFLTRHLVTENVPVIDTDDISRELLVPGQPAFDLVKQMFGEDVCASDGSLNRQRLSRIVFNDHHSLKQLEQILHPRIREVWENMVVQWADSFGVVVIPLLFETGVEKRFDKIIAMACSSKTQHARLISRGWDESHIQKRLGAQLSLKHKVEASDFVIWTDATIATTIMQWESIQRHLLAV